MWGQEGALERVKLEPAPRQSLIVSCLHLPSDPPAWLKDPHPASPPPAAGRAFLLFLTFMIFSSYFSPLILLLSSYIPLFFSHRDFLLFLFLLCFSK